MNIMIGYVDNALILSTKYKELSKKSINMRKDIEAITLNFTQKS